MLDDDEKITGCHGLWSVPSWAVPSVALLLGTVQQSLGLELISCNDLMKKSTCPQSHWQRARLRESRTRLLLFLYILLLLLLATRPSVSQQWVGGRCCLHWTNIAGRTKGRRAEEGGRRPIALLIRVPKNQLNRVCVFIQPPMSSIVPAAAGIVTSGKCKILFWNFCFCAFKCMEIKSNLNTID